MNSLSIMTMMAAVGGLFGQGASGGCPGGQCGVQASSPVMVQSQGYYAPQYAPMQAQAQAPAATMGYANYGWGAGCSGASGCGTSPAMSYAPATNYGYHASSVASPSYGMPAYGYPQTYAQTAQQPAAMYHPAPMRFAAARGAVYSSCAGGSCGGGRTR